MREVLGLFDDGDDYFITYIAKGTDVTEVCGQNMSTVMLTLKKTFRGDCTMISKRRMLSVMPTVNLSRMVPSRVASSDGGASVKKKNCVTRVMVP